MMPPSAPGDGVAKIITGLECGEMLGSMHRSRSRGWLTWLVLGYQ